MRRSQTLSVLVVCLSIGSLAEAQAPAHWLAHDMSRKRPPVVNPGPLSLPAAPPSDAIVLFDGSGLSKWRDEKGGPAKWKIRDGVMESVPDSGYVYSADAFGDVQLHIEWAAPIPAQGDGQGRGNSGVFLMGLYEIQVLDSYKNDTYPDGQAAAVYGQYPPLVNASLPPGEWQSYDIVFRRPRFRRDGTVAAPARISVHHNGLLVQDNVEIWGPTAWLQHQPYKSHPDRLPIGLQDHGNPVRYRNIWLRELREWSAPPPETPPLKTVNLSRDQLRPFTGKYLRDDSDFGEIKLAGSRLQWITVRDQVIDLVPRSSTDFAMRFTAGELKFQMSKTGKVQGFKFFLGGKEYDVEKK